MEDVNSKLLRQYMEAVGVTRMADLRPPVDAFHTRNGRTLGVVLDRRGQFQLELFVVPPGIEIIEFHVHPNVDSFELPVAGSFNFISAGNPNVFESVGNALRERTAVRVRPEDVHGAVWTPKGGAFFSFQHWLNGVTPTTVINDFDIDWEHPEMKKGYAAAEHPEGFVQEVPEGIYRK